METAASLHMHSVVSFASLVDNKSSTFDSIGVGGELAGAETATRMSESIRWPSFLRHATHKICFLEDIAKHISSALVF